MEFEELVLELRCAVLSMGLAYDEYMLGPDNTVLEDLDPDRACGDLLMMKSLDRLVELCKQFDDMKGRVR